MTPSTLFRIGEARLSRAWRLAALSLVFAGLGLTAGCGNDETTKPKPTPAPTPRLTPTSVVDSLVSAYRHRNIKAYAELLADDFQFWFDPATRPDNVPEFWTRLQDSTATDHLFNAPDVVGIRIQLTHGPDVPDLAIGHERWRRIRVTDTFLEIDKQPQVGEIITFRVDGDVQDFYVRQGHSPADTLAGSPSSKQWFLVEWHDLARLSALTALKTSGEAPAPAVQNTTWGTLKALYR